jgi:hypothetical protein
MKHVDLGSPLKAEDLGSDSTPLPVAWRIQRQRDQKLRQLTRIRIESAKARQRMEAVDRQAFEAMAHHALLRQRAMSERPHRPLPEIERPRAP